MKAMFACRLLSWWVFLSKLNIGLTWGNLMEMAPSNTEFEKAFHQVNQLFDLVTQPLQSDDGSSSSANRQREAMPWWGLWGDGRQGGAGGGGVGRASTENGLNWGGPLHTTGGHFIMSIPFPDDVRGGSYFQKLTHKSPGSGIKSDTDLRTNSPIESQHNVDDGDDKQYSEVVEKDYNESLDSGETGNDDEESSDGKLDKGEQGDGSHPDEKIEMAEGSLKQNGQETPDYGNNEYYDDESEAVENAGDAEDAPPVTENTSEKGGQLNTSLHIPALLGVSKQYSVHSPAVPIQTKNHSQRKGRAHYRRPLSIQGQQRESSLRASHLNLQKKRPISRTNEKDTSHHETNQYRVKDKNESTLDNATHKNEDEDDPQGSWQDSYRREVPYTHEGYRSNSGKMHASDLDGNLSEKYPALTLLFGFQNTTLKDKERASRQILSQASNQEQQLANHVAIESHKRRQSPNTAESKENGETQEHRSTDGGSDTENKNNKDIYDQGNKGRSGHEEDTKMYKEKGRKWHTLIEGSSQEMDRDEVAGGESQRHGYDRDKYKTKNLKKGFRDTHGFSKSHSHDSFYKNGNVKGYFEKFDEGDSSYVNHDTEKKKGKHQEESGHKHWGKDGGSSGKERVTGGQEHWQGKSGHNSIHSKAEASPAWTTSQYQYSPGFYSWG